MDFQINGSNHKLVSMGLVKGPIKNEIDSSLHFYNVKIKINI